MPQEVWSEDTSLRRPRRDAGLLQREGAGHGIIQDGTDQELSTINHQQPNLMDSSHVYTDNSGPGAFYLNKASFAPQPLGTVGSLGWNSLVTPAYWDIDLALSREFRIAERHWIELRADAFNLPNTFVPIAVPTTGLGGVATAATGTQFGAPPTGPAFASLNNAQFGQILAAQLVSSSSR